jgi:hypothetical protein
MHTTFGFLFIILLISGVRLDFTNHFHYIHFTGQKKIDVMPPQGIDFPVIFGILALQEMKKPVSHRTNNKQINDTVE